MPYTPGQTIVIPAPDDPTRTFLILVTVVASNRRTTHYQIPGGRKGFLPTPAVKGPIKETP